MFDQHKSETLPARTVLGRTRKSIMVAMRHGHDECALVEVFEDGHARLAKHAGAFVPWWNYIKTGYPVTPMQKLRIRALFGRGAFLMGVPHGRV